MDQCPLCHWDINPHTGHCANWCTFDPYEELCKPIQFNDCRRCEGLGWSPDMEIQCTRCKGSGIEPK